MVAPEYSRIADTLRNEPQATGAAGLLFIRHIADCEPCRLGYERMLAQVQACVRRAEREG